jgi:hypothetical protein
VGSAKDKGAIDLLRGSPLLGERQILTEMTRNFFNPSNLVKFGKAEPMCDVLHTLGAGGTEH